MAKSRQSSFGSKIKSPQSPSFPCPHPGCKYDGKTKSSLDWHFKIHCEKSLFCTYPNCQYSTNFKHHLAAHTLIHTGEKGFLCQFESCSYAATQRTTLQSHMRIHTKEKPYKCRQTNCKFSTAYSSHLKRHERNHSPPEGEGKPGERPSFPCPLCEYKGKARENLSQHVKTHTLEKFFKCDELNCKFEARKKSQVENHKVVHSDDKPFGCSFESCAYRCKYKNALAYHLKTHSEEREYQCGECPYRGKTRTAVRMHLQNVHFDLNPNFQKFRCPEPQCDFAAKTNSNLNAHLLIHKGEKKYACSFPDCSYTAVSGWRVRSHMDFKHSSVKNVKCVICDYTCKTNSQLTSHFRSHTKEQPYFCKERSSGCEYRTKHAGLLREHMKKHHPHLVVL